jgi:hypothetical protein
LIAHAVCFSELISKPVLHVAAQHAVVSFVDFLDRNYLHVGRDIVSGTEIEHLLRFGYAADQRAGKITAFEDEAEDFDRHGFFGCANLSQRAVPF